MATGEEGGSIVNLKRSSSSEIFRPNLAELRVVLLGNCWIQRSLVGNLLVNRDVFDLGTELEHSIKKSGPLKDKTISVINTPDLLHPDLTEDQLTELIKEMANASAPGPHVFLLVLQPESFTERHQHRLQSVLEKFSEQPFDHSMVLLSTDQEESLFPQQVFMDEPHLKRMFAECKYRYQWIKHSEDEEKRLKDFKRKELLTRLEQIDKENFGDYLSYEPFEDTIPPSQTAHFGTKLKETTSLFQKLELTGNPTKCSTNNPKGFHFRILLLGKSDNKKKTLRKFILGSKSRQLSSSKLDTGEWRGKLFKVVQTPDLFSLSVQQVIDEMKRCVSECHPGPNVLLLLVKPSDFTEKNRETLNFILTLLNPTAFKHSIVVFTHKEEATDCANRLLGDCEGRYYDLFTESFDQLMEKIKTMVVDNQGSFVNFIDVFMAKMKMEKIKLIFFGRQGSGKTSAAEAILGPTACNEARSPSECIRRQGEVSGRWVSIVELPALSGKPPKEVMEQCLSCVSLCDPEGVHAFVMVLPMAPLTDEDKAEFKTIQNTFGSRINNFTVVLFTVESDPNVTVFTDFVKRHKDIQELCHSCGERYLIFNIKDQQQVPQLLEKVERLTKSRNEPQCYTTEAFAQTQIEKIVHQTTGSQTRLLGGDKESLKNLRIVLIGKTGSGKSSSGNTILGREVFKSDFGQKAITKLCQKEQSEVDGCCVDVVDTPGLFDRTMSNYEVNEEMLKCISLLAPGPHVFLLVLQIGRFTPEENETLNLIKKGFGKDAQKYTIVVFTHGEELDRNKTSIEDYIEDKCDESCKKLISDCGNRYHVFNNRDQNKRQVQVNELLQKINTLVKDNGGSCYTNEMLQEAEDAIQKEVQRLLKEKEEELRKEMQEMEKKHQQEMQEIQMKMDEEREKTEKERDLKNQELEELKAVIKRVRKCRKTDQKKREEEYKTREDQDRIKEKQYEQNLQELEEKLQRSFDLKSQESKDKMEQERKTWEEQRREWWEKQYREEGKRRQEEQAGLEKLEQEYEEKMETYRNKEQENKYRREQEEKERKELEETHKQQIKDLKSSYEEEARKKAEEFNEFKEKKEKDFAALIEKHLEEVKSLKEEIEQKQSEYQSLHNLGSHKEASLKNNMEELQNKHKQQMIDLAIAVLMEKKENSKTIRDVQKKHKQELEKCEKDLSQKFGGELESKIKELKKKQIQEMKDLETCTNKEDLKQRKRELSDDHEKQLKALESDLWNQQKLQLKEKLNEIRKNHEEELNKFTQDLLKKNEINQAEQITELKKKHQQEMDEFKKKAGGKETEVKLDKLKTKHQIEMDEIMKRMLPKELCPIQ